MCWFRHKKACGLFFVLFFLFLYIVLVSTAGAITRIMPLGDSITTGSSSGVADRVFYISYRKALYDKLKAAGYVVDDEIFVGSLISGQSEADFDPDHEGHGGWRADQIVNGNILVPSQGKLDEWLNAEEPNIILLHIGTNDINGNNEDWHEVEDILVVIDDYESATGKAVWVVLSLIIDQGCSTDIPPCQKSAQTTAFNNNVKDFVFFPGKPGVIRSFWWICKIVPVLTTTGGIWAAICGMIFIHTNSDMKKWRISGFPVSRISCPRRVPARIRMSMSFTPSPWMHRDQMILKTAL